MVAVRVIAWSILIGFSSACLADDTNVGWQRTEIDPTFRAEGVTAFDVNKDGKIDVVNGELWYEAPDWKPHEIRKPGKYDGSTGYSVTFGCFAWDVNADGWTDLICIGFPGVPCHWFENPQNKDQPWKQRQVWHDAANESPQFVDLTGDGKPELVMASEKEGMVGYLEVPPVDKLEEPEWTFTAVSEMKLPIGSYRYYHGLGVSDLNLDGRKDVIIPHGWWEQPEKLNAGVWKFHPLNLAKTETEKPLPASHIYTDDLDLDGDADILMSSAHAHGVWWFENTAGKGGEPTFKYHLIDEHYSQTHALHFQDVNGDGTPDLITGKRFWAHGPKGDPDPNGEIVMFWYELHKTAGMPPKFIPHKIDNGVGTGIGTQFHVTDINGDKLLDIVLSNKKGTNLLTQVRSK